MHSSADSSGYHAAAADDARQRQRDPELPPIAADRDCRALVAQHYFGNARRQDADAVLAGIVSLDDCDAWACSNAVLR
jgi:hypothetical protein